jgi:hypothetical protein
MSFDITTAFVQQYKNNVINLYQQQGSVLRGSVREQQVTGKQVYFERLGATAAVKRTTRHSDTPLVSSPHTRRMCAMVDYEWADLVDQQDKIRILISPDSEYAQNAAWALGRAYDDEIIFAFDGVANSGETGTTPVTFTTGNGAAGDDDFSAAALTLQNILQVKKNLDAKDVPESGRHIVVSPAALYQVLKQTTAPNVASTDYNNVRALVNGDIDTMAGFKWHRTTRLPSPATNMRYCYAWHENSMGIAMGMDINTRITERSDKSYAVQVYVCGTYSATRVQEEGVSRFKVDETK